ncbi:MAG: beta-N-acetylhexosaminidase [Phycisphaerales bacterium]|nr:beta-N-acetylhexosaminidase [Phycisphaerales bacterium]
MATAVDRRLAARLMCIGFDGPVLNDAAREMIHAGVSGVILFARNATSHDELRVIAAAVKTCGAESHGPPIFVSIDHEGGRVVRLRSGMTVVGAMREVGRSGVEEASRVGALFARELRSANVDLDFAPVVDVDSNPANPVIGERSFSADPAIVARCGAAFITALQSGGVAGCAKHFPGHGDTAVDSHLALPRLSHAIERLRAIELPPFAAAARAGVASIMTAHVVFDAVDPGVPATMSRRVIEGVLRDELGFEGVVFSDCLEMEAIASTMSTGEAAVRAIEAGVDCVIICHRLDRQREAIDALASAIASGRLPRARVLQAVTRLDGMMQRFVR